jgi:hypothetical protein
MAYCEYACFRTLHLLILYFSFQFTYFSSSSSSFIVAFTRRNTVRLRLRLRSGRAMIHSAEISMPFASDPRQVFEADCPWRPTGLARAQLEIGKKKNNNMSRCSGTPVPCSKHDMFFNSTHPRGSFWAVRRSA